MVIKVGNSDMSYAERVKTIKNDGEDLFEKYCTKKQYEFHRIGFDEHENNVANYWRLNEVLRNLPDFVINANGKTYVVCVKGTDKIKQKEMNLLDKMIASYHSKQAPLVYAFCFKENPTPIWIHPQRIVKLYKEAVDETWHDGVVFRDLKLRRI